MIRQIMLGGETIPLRKDALDVHLATRGKHRIENEFGDSVRPGMESYEFPLDGEAEDKSK